MAAFTFERLIVVRYPLKRSSICTVRRAKLIIAWLTFTVVIIQLIALFTTGAMEKTTTDGNNKNKTTLIQQSNKSTASAADNIRSGRDWWDVYYEACHIFNIVEAFATLVVPPLLIVIMNGRIINGLYQFKGTFPGSGNISRNRPSSLTTGETQLPRAPAAAAQRVEIIQVSRFIFFYFLLCMNIFNFKFKFVCVALNDQSFS